MCRLVKKESIYVLALPLPARYLFMIIGIYHVTLDIGYHIYVLWPYQGFEPGLEPVHAYLS